MIEILFAITTILVIVWGLFSTRHPRNFLPGPRAPLPLMGDSYVLGKKLDVGFTNLTRQYGKFVGMWMGPDRTAVISDFEVLQDILSKNGTENRPKLQAQSKY